VHVPQPLVISRTELLIGEMMATMRRSDEWMVLADEGILEHTRENEPRVSTEMAESGHIRYSQQYISQRLKNSWNMISSSIL